jgi:SAM-dependent methyltransferase
MRYLFTDVSSHMLRRTATRFSGRDWLSFARLDLDAEPAAEHLGRFDAIVASSALHVAPDIGRALRHLRACLAPGGVLVALEQTQFLSWFDLNMGLQAGFDDRRDRTLRPNHPLLSREAWLQQMRLRASRRPSGQ